MTETGYRNLVERIRGKAVKVPEGVYSLKELQAWMDGYGKATENAIGIIEEMGKGQRDT